MTEEQFQIRLSKEIEQREKAVAHFAEKGIKPQLNKYNALQRYRNAKTEQEKAEAKKRLISSWHIEDINTSHLIEPWQEYQRILPRNPYRKYNEDVVVSDDAAKENIKIFAIVILLFLLFLFSWVLLT